MTSSLASLTRMMSSYILSSYVASNEPTDCYSTTDMCKPMILEERGKETERRRGEREERGREGERKKQSEEGEGERRGRGEERDQERKEEDGTFR